MSKPDDSRAPVSPEGSSNPWSGGFHNWFKQITSWIDSLTPAGQTSHETGYVEVANGIWYKRIGKDMEIDVNIGSGSYPVGITALGSNLIPKALRGGRSNPRGVAFMGDSESGHLYLDNATGDIGVIHQTGASRGLVQGTIKYTIGAT